MKAQNLTISIPSPEGCNKACPYCVSDMTGHLEPNWDLMERNLKTVKRVAENSRINNILITSKGEPLMYPEYVINMVEPFRDYHLEIQTNGKLLLDTVGDLTKDRAPIGFPVVYRYLWVDLLFSLGFNVIAISIDHHTEFEKRRKAIEACVAKGMVIRLCLNLNDHLQEYLIVNNVLTYAQEVGARQILFRNLSIPNGAENEWIEEHGMGHYEKVMAQLKMIVDTEGKFMYKLATGESVYDVRGISVSHSDHCIQEEAESLNDLRSLIYLEDGHLYTGWNFQAPLF